MNYVRKLGFEESPDYDFLRELFSKVLKTLAEPEDGVFDWMLLNGGKGWEASNVCVRPVLFSNLSFLTLLALSPRLLQHSSRKPMQTLPHHILPTANTGGTEITVHTAAALDSCKITPHPQHPLSSAPPQHISRAVAVLPWESEATQPAISAACSLWHLQAGGQASNSARRVHSPAQDLLSLIHMLRPQVRLVIALGLVVVRTAGTLPFPLHMCCQMVAVFLGTIMGQSRSYMHKGRLGRPGPTREMARLRLERAIGILQGQAAREGWLCMIASRCRDSGNRMRMGDMGEGGDFGVHCAVGHSAATSGCRLFCAPDALPEIFNSW